ncbi:hypothetical protein PUN28_016904 [Cardiocondyla obscurior]|uniref:Uncharacterized protein n=1 Tax=Cardiocondyla obscurior TaxID=286306 RepID=A0AAW2EQY1_9HYME
MRRKVTLKEVISVVKLSIFLIQGWPLPKNATKLRVCCLKLYYCLCVITIMCLCISLIYSATNHLDNLLFLTNLSVMISGTFHANINFIFNNIYRHYIQVQLIFINSTYVFFV